MSNERRAGGEGAVAGHVVAMVSADDDVTDRLGCQPADLLDEPPCLGDASLSVGNEDNIAGYNDRLLVVNARLESSVPFRSS
jgi:hypothetical protein